MKKYFLPFLLLVPFCTIGQGIKNQGYKLYSTSQQKEVNIDDMISNIDNADILFYGESHTDSIGHVFELSLLQKISAKYPHKTALSMEMFETDTQPVLNEYLKGAIREKDMIKDARAWPNYTDYRPMVEYAKANKIPVLAANAPSRYVHMVTDKGLTNLQQLDKMATRYLAPLPIDTATGVYYKKFIAMTGGHGDIGGMKIYQSQNLWDATMGWSIAQYFKKNRGNKILHINGSFHSEEKLGTVAQLKKYAPRARIINIAHVDEEKNFDNPDWTRYQKLGDYLIITQTKK